MSLTRKALKKRVSTNNNKKSKNIKGGKKKLIPRSVKKIIEKICEVVYQHIQVIILLDQ